MISMLTHKYNNIISIENLLSTWGRFICGKRRKKDVMKFEAHLADNLIELHTMLKNRTYEHAGYSAFNISDPKPRNIHKAIVRDRVLHHLIYKELYHYFDARFIHDSYSCRKEKGTHRAFKRFKVFADRVSKNNTRTCHILKCDIRKFFASVDHEVLRSILKRHIEDEEILWLINQVVKSFHTTSEERLRNTPGGRAIVVVRIVNVVRVELDLAVVEVQVRVLREIAVGFRIVVFNYPYHQSLKVILVGNKARSHF